MATPDLRPLSLATLILAGVHIGLPWAVGGRSPVGQTGLILFLVLAGAIGLVLGGAASRLRPSPLFLLTGIFIGASALHTMYPDRTVQSLLLLLSYLLAAALAARAARVVPWAGHALLASISIAGVLVCFEGMLRIFLGGEGGLYSQVLTGPFGYPNAAGGFFVLTAGAALAEARDGRGTAIRGAALAAALVSLTGLVLTHSDGAMLAAGIGLGVWAVIDRNAWWSHRRAWAAAAAVGLLLTIAIAPNRLLGLPLRLRTLFAAGVGDSSFTWRLHIWKWTWAMVRDHPWWGVGPGAFPVALTQYQRIPYVSGQNPHNLYLEIAAEYGLPIAVLAVVALPIFLARVRSAIRQTSVKDPTRSVPAPNCASNGQSRTLSPRRKLGSRSPWKTWIPVFTGMTANPPQDTTHPSSQALAVLLATLVAFAVHSLWDLDWSFPAVAIIAATMLGLAASHLAQTIRYENPVRPLWRGITLALMLGMAFLVLSRYYATTLVDRAQISLASRDVALGQQDLAWALRLNPMSFPAHRSMARTRLYSGDLAGAIEAANRSVRIAPADPNTHNLAGEITAAAGRWDAAVEKFRAAVDLAPYSQLRFHAGLVESASNAGQGPEVRSRYEQAVAIFTEERVLDLGARCLMPGDRYLLARMSRIAARSYREVGDSTREEVAMDLARRLAQPDARGICVTRGRPGQTSPEAAVVSFWRLLADGGWPQAEQLLAPELRGARTGKDLAMWQDGNRPLRAHVAWVAALSGGESFANLHFMLEIEAAPGSLVSRCAQASSRVIHDNWFLDNLPVIEAAPCQP